MSEAPPIFTTAIEAGPIRHLRTLMMTCAVLSLRMSGHGARDGGAELLIRDGALEYAEVDDRRGTTRRLEMLPEDVIATRDLLNAAFPTGPAVPPPIDPAGIQVTVPMIDAAAKAIGNRTGQWLCEPTIAAALRAALDAIASPPDRSVEPGV